MPRAFISIYTVIILITEKRGGSVLNEQLI